MGVLFSGIALCACGTGGAAPQGIHAMTADSSSTTTTLHDLEADPARPVRVIVTVKPGAAALQQVKAAAMKAGASSVVHIEGQNLIVIEGKPSHIRAAVATGQVLRIQRDAASPTN